MTCDHMQWLQVSVLPRQVEQSATGADAPSPSSETLAALNAMPRYGDFSYTYSGTYGGTSVGVSVDSSSTSVSVRTSSLPFVTPSM